MAEDVDRVLSSSEAQAIQDKARVLTWAITAGSPRYPRKFVARPHTTTHDGGRYLPLVLVSDTLENLHARLPAGISRRYELSYFIPTDVIELWD